MFSGAIGVGDYFTRFMIPTLIGNTIGGVSLVAILNHAPLREELPGGDAAMSDRGAESEGR